MEIHQHQFEDYVRQIYNGSSRPLKYSHLVKGAFLQYLVKKILDNLGYDYVEASEVGKGADFNVGISPNLVPIECKNEKFHTESPKSVEIDIISRFKDYPKSCPKILLTSTLKYEFKARKLLNESNIQIIKFPKDINDFNELNEFLTEIFPLIARSLYKFTHYKKYKLHQQSSEHKKGVDTSSNNVPVFFHYYHPHLISSITSIIYHPPIINYLVSYLILYVIFIAYTRSIILHYVLGSFLILYVTSHIACLILRDALYYTISL
ncbi:hypothetical protein ACFLQ6_08425 [Thermoproteota archaeon]